MSALTAYTSTTLAPAASETSLQHGEPLGPAVKRVTMELLETAAAGYFKGEAEFGRAVHKSRKAIKRVRALLRLVRGELGDRVYRYENWALRDTARLVSDVRSSAAIIGTAKLVSDLYGDLLADHTFDEMVARLERRRDVIEAAALEDSDLINLVVRNLERAYHRYSGWPAEPEAREIYGMGVRDGFAAIKPGLTRIYARGRREMVAAYAQPSAERFHLWRKRAKYLRHQMEFLTPLWPEVVGGYASSLDTLGEVLGEDHDLAELTDLIFEQPDLCPDPRERSLFAVLAQQRRSELQVAAEVLGRRAYAEKPASMHARFGEYWESRRMEMSRPLDVLALP